MTIRSCEFESHFGHFEKLQKDCLQSIAAFPFFKPELRGISQSGSGIMTPV